MSAWLTEKVAADYAGFSPGTFRNWRLYGIGPAFVKLPNGSIRYSAEELERWIRSGEKAAA